MRSLCIGVLLVKSLNTQALYFSLLLHFPILITAEWSVSVCVCVFEHRLVWLTSCVDLTTAQQLTLWTGVICNGYIKMPCYTEERNTVGKAAVKSFIPTSLTVTVRSQKYNARTMHPCSYETKSHRRKAVKLHIISLMLS